MSYAKMVAAVALGILLIGGRAGADNVYLLSSDPGGVSSFITTTNWSNGQGPSPLHEYWVGGPGQRVLRTPDGSPAAFTFGGNSLTVTNNGMVRYKGSNSTITINRLTVDGGVLHNGNGGRTWTLRGGVTLGPSGCILMGETADRTIHIPDPIVGVGGLIVSGPGRMILSADNTYEGGTYISNGFLRVGSGGTTGTWGQGPLTNQGTLEFNIPGDRTISGPLYPAGTGGVSKLAAGVWTWMEQPAAEYAGVTTISAGTLVLGADDKLGTGTLDMRNNGTIIRALDANTRTVTNLLSISANIVFGSADTGELVFQGPVNNGGANKELTISNAVSTFGNFINTGQVMLRGPGIFRLAAGADIALSTSIVVAAGGRFDATANGGFTNPVGKTFSGSGSVMGDLTAYGNLVPGGAGPGTLTLSNSLALSDSTLFFDIAAAGTVGGNTNDLIDVAGNVSLSGLSTINILGASFAPAYTLIRYAGGRTGDASNFTIGNAADYRQTLTINTDVPGEIRLLASGTGSNLTWSGNAGTLWDVRTTYNWNGMAELFYSGDAVRFDNTGVGPTVDLTGALLPAQVHVDSDIDYTFQGTGKISGGTPLVKTGAGTLIVSTANDYAGGTVVSNGTLRVGAAAALGGAGGTVVGGTGTLDVNGFALYNRPGTYVISGNGFGDQGAIMNSGGAQNNAIRCLALAGDAMISAPGNRWDVRSPAYGVDEVNLNGFTLTKQGAGQISFIQQTITNSGAIEVAAGTVVFTRCFADGNGAVNLWPTVVLGFENYSTGWFARAVNATGATVRLIGNFSFGLGGPITLTADNSVEAPANQTFTWSNHVSGAGSLTKTGAGTLALLGTNSCTGPTIVNTGTLRVDGAMTGGGDMTVVAGATLRGTGVVHGAVNVLDDAILAPGDSAGTLTIRSNLTIGATAILDYELGTQSDTVVVGGNLQLSGRLRVADSGGFGPGTYTLIRYDGTFLGGAPAIEQTPTTNYTYSIQTGTAGEVNLVVSSGSLTPFQQWQMDYFGSTSAPNAQPDADWDGDLYLNGDEFYAGTNPTNDASALVIVRVQPSGANLMLSWNAAGIRTNRLQVCTDLASGIYTDLGDPIVISTPGDQALNYFDLGAATNPMPRFYRVHVEP